MSKLLKQIQIATETGTQDLENLTEYLKKSGYSVDDLRVAINKGGKSLNNFATNVGMSSKELKSWFNRAMDSAAGLEEFADVAGMTADEFKKAWEEDALGALSAFVGGLNDTERNGKSAIQILEDMDIKEVRLSNTILSLANAGNLMTNAVDTANKAWKENTALSNEANKRYADTKSQVEMLKHEVTKTAIEFGDELAPSLRQIVKDAKPMLNSISSAVKSFSKLDAQTKKTILKMGALAVAGGPVIKMTGKLITTLGSTKKAFGTFTSELGVLKNNGKEASESAISLTKTISGLMSPAGLAKTAIVALTGAAIAWGIKAGEASRKVKQAQEEEIRATKESLEATKEKISAIESERNAIEESMSSKISEIDYNQQLFNELKTIVDENGKVKEGYEARAKFITEELSEALGKEISLNGNIIDNYKDIQKEVEKTLLKKQAEAKYEEIQAKALEAREREKELIAEVGQKQEELNQKQEEYDRLYNERLENYRQSLIDDMADWMKTEENLAKVENQAKSFAEKDLAYISEEISNMTAEVNALNSEIEKGSDEQREAIQVGELWAENSEESLKKIIDLTKRTVTVNGETRDLDLKDEIQYWQYKIEESKKAHEKAIENNDEYNKKLTEENQKQYEDELRNLKEQLKAITSITEENTPEVQEAWRNLASGSKDIYTEILATYPEEERQKIEEMTGIIVQKTPEMVTATEQSMNQILAEMDKNSEFKAEAIENLKSFLSGMKDDDLRSLLQSAGVSDVEAVMKGIREGNLAEDEGKKILTSLKRGLLDNSLTTSLFSSARSISNKISSLLSVTAKVDASGIPGHKSGLDYVPYDNYIARLHKGERVLTAQENKEYMAGNIENKIANRNIVVQFYPQSMNEAEMQKAERYIARKWGMSLL